MAISFGRRPVGSQWPHVTFFSVSMPNVAVLGYLVSCLTFSRLSSRILDFFHTAIPSHVQITYLTQLPKHGIT